jgi:dephospho-CoA kinase
MINKSLTIIGLTGLSNAGKSLIKNHFKKKGFLVFSLGNYIRQELDSRNLKHTYENMRCVSIEYAPMKNTTLIDRFIKDIQNTNIENELIVLDGIKKISEIECLKKDFKVVIVAILASRQTRYRRFNKRGRPDDVMYKNFLKRDEEEIQYGIGEVITLSDYFLVNEGTKEEAKNIFDSILLKICERPPLKTRTLENYCI